LARDHAAPESALALGKAASLACGTIAASGLVLATQKLGNVTDRTTKLFRFVGVLEGKTAIVTGASSGIGAATAAAFRREGARVLGGARRVDEVQTELKHELDVTDPESCGRFIEFAIGELDSIDILVNNAGLGLGRDPFWEGSEQDEETVLETNVHGLIRITRLCLPHIRDGGHVVNMGSIAGRQAYENAAVYVASKFAVRGFTYALREDLLSRPIRLTTVDPGLVESNFSRVRFRGDEEKAKAPYDGVDPLRPDDVAECVLFAVTRPPHVNIDELVVKALAQSSAVRIARS
jgi:3-hydroxy acid dehydrogenase/malonic semialdehyde reductase